MTETPSARLRLSAATHDLEEVWLALTMRDCRSIVVVPADPDRSAGALATALAEAGTRLSHEQVSALTIDIDQDPKVMADVQQMIRHDRERARGAAQRSVADGADARPGGPPAMRSVGEDPPGLAPRGICVISIPPVTRESLGVSIARASDAVLVVLEMRRTRMADARRTIDLVGRDRIAGTILVR
jgi:hypothetical protein